MQLKAHAVAGHPGACWTTLAALEDETNVVAALTGGGLGEEAARSKARLIGTSARAVRAMGHAADAPAVAAFVPGRIEVFGKHTDYCGGRSLLCAVDRGLCIVAVRGEGRRVRLTEVLGDATVQFPQNAELSPTAGHWSNYPMTVARRLARDFPTAACGMDAAFAGDLPLAAGLSSSSALIIGAWLALSAAGDVTSQPRYAEYLGNIEELVTYLGAIEAGRGFANFAPDGGVGTTGGSQDHAAILLSRAHTLSQISYNPVRIERTVALPAGWALAVANSAVLAEKTGAAMARYNALSSRAAQVLEVWNRRSGRDDATLAEAIRGTRDAVLTLERWLSEEDDEGPALTRRLLQFVLECEVLVPAATAALRSGDIAGFGRTARQSQSASEAMLDNQVPQTIALTAAAYDAGAAAASAFGAGFGGSCWALVRTERAQAFVSDWLERYRAGVDAATAERAVGWVTDPGPGALWIGV